MNRKSKSREYSEMMVDSYDSSFGQHQNQIQMQEVIQAQTNVNLSFEAFFRTLERGEKLENIERKFQREKNNKADEIQQDIRDVRTALNRQLLIIPELMDEYKDKYPQILEAAIKKLQLWIEQSSHSEKSTSYAAAKKMLNILTNNEKKLDVPSAKEFETYSNEERNSGAEQFFKHQHNILKIQSERQKNNNDNEVYYNGITVQMQCLPADGKCFININEPKQQAIKTFDFNPQGCRQFMCSPKAKIMIQNDGDECVLPTVDWSMTNSIKNSFNFKKYKINVAYFKN